MDDLLNNAPCGFLAFADDGAIVLVNATLLEMLGHEQDDLTGRRVESILSAGGRVFYQTHFFPLLKLHGRAEEIYLALRSRSGEDVPVLANAVRRERGGSFVNDCVLVPMRRRHQYEDEILQEKKRNYVIAERLQAALRPALPGKVPGLDVADYYKPALEETSVGGDFFDVFSLEKGCFALIVADLSGKGLMAAAQTATVRHMLRALLYLDIPLVEAITKLNDLLTEHNLLTDGPEIRASFATLFAGVYDANQGTVAYVSCGQEPGLLFRAATGEVEELPSTGPVLGGYGGADFNEARVTLAPGDVLALFTDGLTEAGPTRRNFLEIPGIVRLLKECAPVAPTAQAIVSCLMAGVEAFAGPDGIRDDVCLLVARVEKRNG